MTPLKASRLRWLAVLATTACIASRADAQGGAIVEVARFQVTDTLGAREFVLSRDLVLHVTPAWDAKRHLMGWDLTVTDRRLANSPNFFYACLCGHGPRLHDYYAWHFAEKYFPHERTLAVFGYPLDVRVSCAGCRIEGAGPDAVFAAGTLVISTQRLRESNPRQQRISR